MIAEPPKLPVNPRHCVNRGSVLASGFIIRWDVVGMKEARRRVLSLWQSGLRVKKTDAAFIVLLPAPARVIADQTLGEALVRHERWLVALPLEKAEVERLLLPGESVIFAQAGNIRHVHLAELPDEPITQWIDTEPAWAPEVASLGAPPEALAFHPPQFDSRDIPGVPPASSELKSLLAELRQKSSPQGAQTPTPGVGIGLIDVLGVFKRLWNSVRSSLARGWSLLQKRPTVQTASEQSPAPAPRARNNRLGLWLNRNISRLFNLTRFSRLLNSRHARYLARMVAMMQSGDIEEGLRHAIPLSDAPSLENQKLSWFGLPLRRTNLSINPLRAAPGSTLALGSQIYEFLRKLYRQAFERLEGQGRIEEAAFVLTELLASHAEAVSFLEKHGRLRLAAEIAEAKGLSPAMAIRLWWLAKERKRAISLALRTGEFERAIQHLSGSHPEEARLMRLVWAERLAQAGKYLAAVEAIWPIKAERNLATQWLDQAIELGGIAGGIALAQRAARYPESFAELLPRVEQLLGDESEELARGRRAFADTLRQELPTPESQSLARMAARSLVRDLQQGITELNAAQLRHLLDYTGDSSLRADVPAIKKLRPDRDPPAAGSVAEITAADVGHHSIADLAVLPDGKILLALGEAGLVFLSREGKLFSQSSQPAHKLVVSDDGSRAIGIAPRVPVARLVRIDVASRTASYWCDTTITSFTDHFDGFVWPVANGQDVFLIDTLAPGFEPMWKIPELGGHVVAMQRNRKERRLYALSGAAKILTLWTFEQPSCTLRAKQEYNEDLNNVASSAQPAEPGSVLLPVAIRIAEPGNVYEHLMLFAKDGEVLEQMICERKTGPIHGFLESVKTEVMRGNLHQAAFQDRWMAIPVSRNNGVEVFLYDILSKTGELCLRLHGSRQIALHFTEGALACADELGRVVVLNPVNCRIVRDLRV